VEEGRREDAHVHGSARLAHRVPPGGEVQEDPQEHHDQHDGHPGGGHREAGGRSRPRLRAAGSFAHFSTLAR